MRLHVDGLDEGHLVSRGHVVLHERARQELPRFVVAQRLVDAAADALGDAAVDLAIRISRPRRYLKCFTTFLAMRSICFGSSVTGPSTRYSSPDLRRSSIRALMPSIPPTM